MVVDGKEIFFKVTYISLLFLPLSAKKYDNMKYSSVILSL